MKVLNKKGLTLIEIIVSVGLVAIVMLFLFNLLIDLQYEEIYASYAKHNQIKRATVMKNVQDDFINMGLSSVTVINQSDGKEVVFYYENSVSRSLYIRENSISYNNEKWILDNDDNPEIKFDTARVVYSKTPDNLCNYLLNVDSNGDSVCDYNCDLDDDGILDVTKGDGPLNTAFKKCSKFSYMKVVVPVLTGEEENIIDDLEFFYIKKL